MSLFPERFAIYRKDMQLFEILRPHGLPIFKFVYEDHLGVPLWHVVRNASYAVGLQDIDVNGRNVGWTYTGAVLSSPDGAKTIPIVQFSRNGHIPTIIHGIRVLYMDKSLGHSYFSKKMGQEPKQEPKQEQEQEQEQEQGQKQKKTSKKAKTHNWDPHAVEDESLQSKGLSLLALIFTCMVATIYGNYVNIQMKSKGQVNRILHIENEVCHDTFYDRFYSEYNPLINSIAFP